MSLLQPLVFQGEAAMITSIEIHIADLHHNWYRLEGHGVCQDF